MKEITAKLNNYRASPRKTRIVADLIKGKKVKDAIVQLDFLTKKSANPIVKLLKSAISNARNDFKVADENSLIVKTIIVNAGPVLKRSRPRSRGMANQILKRTSRITIVLSEQPSPKIKSVKSKVKRT
jgi:large subunit ribosomal protein L22